MRYWVLILLLLPAAHAATLNAQYDLSLTQTSVEYQLQDVEQQLTIPLPYDVRTVRIDNNQTPVEYELRISDDATIHFTSSAYTERGNYFAADLARINASISEVTVYLPEGARLQRGLNSQDPSIRPRPRDAFTDGTRMIFTWDGADLEPARAVLVDYQTNIPGPQMILLLAGAAILAGLIILVTGRKDTRNKNLTRNLYKDEKALIELLLAQDEEEMWQKQLTHKSGLSKVKVSRKLSKLEEKGLIEKIPHGNTNKIRITRSEE